ncbi:MAG: hypothetical protein WBP64_16785 [Nitrososphaeraceae archaeon]
MTSIEQRANAASGVTTTKSTAATITPNANANDINCHRQALQILKQL